MRKLIPIQVIPSTDGNWVVRKAGSTRATKSFDTQSEAINFAKKISRHQGVVLYIHKKNGLVREKNSYKKQLKSLEVE
ncbi:MAG: DUF2188 domain-containing protein [Candidatus Helarchaeota archaeon]